MTFREMYAVALAIALACGGASRGEAAAPADCNAVPVELAGRLVAREEYGPPGWGEDPEHDTRWTLYALVLSPASAQIVAEGLSPCAGENLTVQEVQLWMAGSDSSPLRRHTNQQVNVVGALHLANGPPGEVLPVQLEVTRVAAQRAL